MKKHILIPLILLMLLVSGAAGGEEDNVSYSCRRLSAKPLMDGRIDGDPAWKNIPRTSGFVKLGTNRPVSKQTSFRLGYTSEALFVGIECEEPEIEKIKSTMKTMEDVWRDDSIELFIFPKEADQYHHFIANAIGSRWKGMGRRRTEISLGDWLVKIRKSKDGYSMEIQIPWVIFQAIPEKNEVWTLNVCRNITTSGDKHTTWARLKAPLFHQPSNFGRIVFKDEIPPDKKRETQNKIIRSLRKKLTASLVPISRLKKAFREAGKKYPPSLREEITSFLKNYEEFEKQVSQLDALTVKKARLLLAKSSRMLKDAKVILEDAKVLKADILRDSFFETGKKN